MTAPSRFAPLAVFLPYLARRKGRIAAALVALLFAAATTLVVPLAVRRVIDHGFSSDNAAFVDRYFAALALVAFLLALASAGRYYLVTTLGERVVADVRADVFRRVIGLDQAFFDRTRSGEIVSRLTADTAQMKSAVGASISIALRNIVLFFGAAAMMAVTSPGLSVLVLAAIPVIVLPLVGFGRRVRRRSREAQDTLAEASAFAAEAIGAARAVQSFTAESRLSERFHVAVEHAFEGARIVTLTRALLTGAGIFLVFASVVAVLWFGAQDVLAGRTTPGALGQFVLYAVFAAGALGELSQVWGELSQAAGAAERLADLLGRRPTIQAPPNATVLPEPARGALAFENVSFAYPTREGPVLSDVSFSIAPGETVAVVGPSGAGKTTVFQLVQRFYDPERGRVLLDDADLAMLDPVAARRRVAIVPQETAIFADSILENIRFGRPEASDAEVIEAARLALVAPFAEALPDQYATAVGERGVTLSGGERQRIAIARAILKDAPLLLLDEATSALDAESEALVQTALDRLMQGRTTLVIAHRLATVIGADRILAFDSGRIAEEGSHAELLARDGLYARLARLQFRQSTETPKEDDPGLPKQVAQGA